MKKILFALALIGLSASLVYAQGTVDFDAIGKTVKASLAKTDELLLKKERQAAGDELEKTAKMLYESAKTAQEAGNATLTGLGQEFELAARRVKDGSQQSLDQLKKFSDYQINVAYRMAEAEMKVSQKNYKDAKSELERVSSYLGEIANGVGEDSKKGMMDAKKDVDNLAATLAEGTMGAADITGGAIQKISDHIEALITQKAPDDIK
jgi:hypothetical protein